MRFSGSSLINRIYREFARLRGRLARNLPTSGRDINGFGERFPTRTNREFSGRIREWPARNRECACVSREGGGDPSARAVEEAILVVPGERDRRAEKPLQGQLGGLAASMIADWIRGDSPASGTRRTT